MSDTSSRVGTILPPIAYNHLHQGEIELLNVVTGVMEAIVSV